MDDFVMNNGNGLDSNLPNPKTLVRYFLDDNRARRSYKIERNQNCPCGSGLKYKKCCLNNRPDKNKDEYLEEIFELMKFNGLEQNQDEILELAEQLMDEYPVEPEVIELYISILDYYGYQEEILYYIARLAKIRKDEYEDEYYLSLMYEIFMEGYFQDVVDIYELKSDLFDKDPDMSLFYGVSLFEIDRVTEASDILDVLINNPGFYNKYSYDILLEYLYESGKIDLATEFYYDNFDIIDSEDNVDDNRAQVLNFFQENFDIGHLESQFAEDSGLKFLLKAFSSPLEFYDKIEGMTEAAVNWYSLWDKHNKAVSIAEDIIGKVAEADLSLEFYYKYARSLYNTGEESAAFEVMSDQSSSGIAGDLPTDLGDLYLENEPAVKINFILIYYFIQSDQVEKAIELLTEIDSKWLLPLLTEFHVEYLVDWNGESVLDSLVEILLDNLETFSGLTERDIFSFYYWAKISYTKYLIIDLGIHGEGFGEIRNVLFEDSAYNYDGLTFKYFEFLYDNFNKLIFNDFEQKDISHLNELIDQKPVDYFDTRVILDGICWLDSPAGKIVEYVEKISDDLLFDEEAAFKLFATMKSKNEEDDDLVDFIDDYRNLGAKIINTSRMFKIGIFALRNLNKVFKNKANEFLDNKELEDYKGLKDYIDETDSLVSDPAKEVLIQLSSEDDHKRLEALRNAANYRDEITPVLLKILEDTAIAMNMADLNDGEFSPDGFPDIIVESILLLAEFKEERAFPLVLDIINVFNDDALYYILGDVLTDDGAAILSSIYNGDLDKLKEIIEDSSIYEFSRVTAFNTLIALIANGKLSADDLHDYFRHLYSNGLEKEKSFLWDDLIINTARFGFDDLSDEVNLALKKYSQEIYRGVNDYVEVVEEYGDYKDDMANFTGEFYHYQDINSAAKVLEKWVR